MDNCGLHETQTCCNINELSKANFKDFLLSNYPLISISYGVSPAKKPFFPLKYTLQKGGGGQKGRQKPLGKFREALTFSYLSLIE
jgi:hypothetical protein